MKLSRNQKTLGITSGVLAVIIAVLSMVYGPDETANLLAPITRTPSKTPSSTPGGPSLTPTLTKTNTPSPTPSSTPTLPGATNTLTPTPIPGTFTPTPISGDPCFEWHPYGVDLRHPSLPPHTHGWNPCDFIDIFGGEGGELDKYLTAHGISGYPLSSALEEHEGLVWLYTHLDQCELFVSDLDNLPNPVGCPTDILIRVHTNGTQAHGSKRFHSEVVFVRGCDKSFSQCDYTMIMHPQIDYGVLFNPYKQSICHISGEPTDSEGNVITDLNQPPYRGLQPPAFRGEDPPSFWSPFEVLASEIWSSLRIEANSDFYPNDPNALVQATWTLMDSRQYFVCGGDPIQAAQNNATRFMHFTLKIQDLPEARPFSGFTDFYGKPADNCTTEGPTCFPIYVGPNFPAYPVWFNFPVLQNGGNPDVVQQEFDPALPDYVIP